MSRLIAAAVLGLVLHAVPAAARADTDPPSDDVTAIAAEAGVDVVDLEGAALTTHLEPRAYLIAVGELAPPLPPLSGAIARADCIISKESGGLDVYNRQGSGAAGPGQYFPGTWASHVALYRHATGYAGSLSLHSLGDVRRVMSWILGTYPQMRTAWTVGGC